MRVAAPPGDAHPDNYLQLILMRAAQEEQIDGITQFWERQLSLRVYRRTDIFGLFFCVSNVHFN